MATTDTITLKIGTPAGVYEGTFKLSTTVNEVITEVAKDKRLSGGDELELYFDGNPLPRDKSLASLDLKDDAVLTLVATGSGV